MSARNVYTIPAGVPFLDALARGIDARLPKDDPLALARATVLLPTRRAARALGQALLASGGGGARLLPRIRPIGDVDEDALTVFAEADDGDLPPAIATVTRELYLARLILEAKAAEGVSSADQAVALARQLAAFLDECQTQGVSLDALDGIVPDAFAQHWQTTLTFLSILKTQWPTLLSAMGAIDPAQRRDILIRRLTARWRDAPPDGFVFAAGSTGSIPATAELLACVAAMPNGAVILPGLDTEIDDEAWGELGPSHPQFGLKQLLGRMGLARDDVRLWTEDAGALAARRRLLSAALRPPSATDAWRGFVARDGAAIREGVRGLSRIDLPNERAEAAVIALTLREAIDAPGATAALVTPDRALARRVSTELRRYGIDADDSAGAPLTSLPNGVFLQLIADCAAEDFAPAPVLALLKHPLARAGHDDGALRDSAEALERAVLRGPRPRGGFDGIAVALAACEDTALKVRASVARDALRLVRDAFAPFLKGPHDLATLAAAHVEAAEALSRDGADALPVWEGDAGEAAALLFEALTREGADILACDLSAYARVVGEMMRGATVRPGRPQHAQVFIWGPLEARLQSADTIVLGGLNEGTWPQIAESDPWVSRPMRTVLGLEQPERRIGLSAHDFAQLAAQPSVVLTRSAKAEGAPATPSRWLTRLEALIGAQGATWKDAATPARVHAFDTPPRGKMPPPPSPCPPVAARPRTLSVTRVEEWVRDPYASYARYVLRLRALDPIDADMDARARGTLIHGILEDFIRAHGAAMPADPHAAMRAIADRHFATLAHDAAAQALWRPRFDAAAAWFLRQELLRRTSIAKAAAETVGTFGLKGPAGPFTLSAKADRIDRLRDGAIEVLDYKTGAARTRKEMETGFAPQLPLEGAIAAAGGFGPDLAGAVRALVYFVLSGAGDGGKEQRLDGADAAKAVEAALNGLQKRIAAFDKADTPYLSRPHMKFRRDPSDYDHLARFAEWSAYSEDAP